VAEVDHLEHAEDQRQPDGDEKQQHADDEAAGGLRHQTGGTGETADEHVEIQGKCPLRRAGGSKDSLSLNNSARFLLPLNVHTTSISHQASK
jgi:hypothetical protein